MKGTEFEIITLGKT